MIKRRKRSEKAVEEGSNVLSVALDGGDQKIPSEQAPQLEEPSRLPPATIHVQCRE